MKNLIGIKFTRLTPIKYTGTNKYRESLWLCQCDCGNKKIISGHNLKSGHTKSCGCMGNGSGNLIHGHSRKGKESKTYRSWKAMVQRCTNTNNPGYKNYGGRKITICYRWSNKNPLGFQNFLEDMGERPKGKSIDRIKNNKGYHKNNCKWSTGKEQSRNQRTNHLLKYNGKKLCIIEWAEITGISKETIRARIRLGWPIKKALTIPVREKRKIK